MPVKSQASGSTGMSQPSPESDSHSQEIPSISAVLLNVPNTVTYSRIILLLWAAVVAASRPRLALTLWLLNFVLDGVDGALARRLGQTSAFGAFLDVAVDIASRGLLWVGWAAAVAAADAAAVTAAGATAAVGTPVAGATAPATALAAAGGGAAGATGRGASLLAAAALPLSLSVVLLECLVFTCTHAAAGAAWKHESHFDAAPAWVAAVMARGFKTPPGCLAIAGLMGCPLWLWACRALPQPGPWSHPALGAVLVAGRLLAAGVEVWLLGAHLRALLRSDERELELRRARRSGQGLLRQQQEEEGAGVGAVAGAVVGAVAGRSAAAEQEERKLGQAEEEGDLALAGGVAAVIAEVGEGEEQGGRGTGAAAERSQGSGGEGRRGSASPAGPAD
ncbi:hypothetical protein HYH02_009135 [Chlamydomonas schloesseri]|uniref:CDP-diacylglycerol--inositol 3-phosphatidyltransferase n=1 Tax=Chlamydomonas schloesseri TaxID=2026947 RepID=A0A835WB91_9CHLO|nr:hypothetical protein HYH02_009135 [Chlamydomonas schloesseri]|eukprot:KAG2444197.1 hypothetical protein HYH02_009135 [Chlamydomonas schloesseri]